MEKEITMHPHKPPQRLRTSMMDGLALMVVAGATLRLHQVCTRSELCRGGDW